LPTWTDATVKVDVIIKRSLNEVLSMTLYATTSLPFYLGEQRNQLVVGFNSLAFLSEIRLYCSSVRDC